MICFLFLWFDRVPSLECRLCDAFLSAYQLVINESTAILSQGKTSRIPSVLACSLLLFIVQHLKVIHKRKGLLPASAILYLFEFSFFFSISAAGMKAKE